MSRPDKPGRTKPAGTKSGPAKAGGPKTGGPRTGKWSAGASPATSDDGALGAAPTADPGASQNDTTDAASSRLDPWSRYWLAPVAAVRPWLLRKITLFILAFDVLDTHLGPAWRYGAAGFNVPHFAWMEALPLPTTAAYVGMLFLVATGALVAALVPRPPRALLFAIAALYTWGWSCSMHDSYQHHYLLSVVLFAIALLPPLDSRDLFGDASTPGATPNGLVPRVHSLGWTFLTSACAVVYAFTAVSKTEPDWLSGDAMRSITRGGETIRSAIDLAASMGIEESDFYWWLGHGVVPAQIVCALAYALAPLADGASTPSERTTLSSLLDGLFGPRGRGAATLGGQIVGAFLGLALGFGLGLGTVGIALTTLTLALTGALLFLDANAWRFLFTPGRRPTTLGVGMGIGALTAVSFHVGAEHLALSIGWFSSYMIAIALVALLPARWLSLVALVITLPWRTRARFEVPELPRLVLAALAGGTSLVILGQLADLPGAVTATTIATGVLVLVVGLAVRGAIPTRTAAQAALACLVAGAALAGWLRVSDARFDYYRFGGGDFRRRLDYESALDAYLRANRHAPRGQSRDDRIEEMRALIRARRGED